MFQVQRNMGHADLDELAGYVQETPEARPICSQLSVSILPFHL